MVRRRIHACGDFIEAVLESRVRDVGQRICLREDLGGVLATLIPRDVTCSASLMGLDDGRHEKPLKRLADLFDVT